jgi:transcriptional regulator with XRE-family HTH domain
MFSDVFVQILEENGVSAYKLSKETGIPQSCLSDYKTGRAEPTAKNLKKIADYFGITVTELIEGKPQGSFFLGLTEEESRIIEAYRAATVERKESVCLLLGVERKTGGQDV